LQSQQSSQNPIPTALAANYVQKLIKKLTCLGFQNNPYSLAIWFTIVEP